MLDGDEGADADRFEKGADLFAVGILPSQEMESEKSTSIYNVEEQKLRHWAWNQVAAETKELPLDSMDSRRVQPAGQDPKARNPKT